MTNITVSPIITSVVASIVAVPGENFTFVVTDKSGNKGEVGVFPATPAYDYDFGLSNDPEFVELFGVPTLQSSGTVADTIVDDIINGNREALVQHRVR